MADEGFREIQLKGKQLVFLFMAATVVAVVVFLCGVMVGRGVQGSVVGSVEQAGFDPGGAEPTLSPARAASTDRTAPITAQETLTYSSLLEDPAPLAESLAPAAEPATVVSEPVVLAPSPPVSSQPDSAIATPQAVARAAAPAAAPSPAPTVVAPAVARPLATAPAIAEPSAPLAEPPGSGFVVQVAAVRQRAQANAIASGLSAKGYLAFVTVSGPNFRVRVGKYADRGEAESVASRLAQEERFEPWITR
jgi:cell division septation protein DedD